MSRSNLSFSFALAALKDGSRIAREGWNGKGMWLELHFPDAGGLMTLPYIYTKTAQGNLVPWLASQTDLLANDWSIVDGEEPVQNREKDPREGPGAPAEVDWGNPDFEGAE